MKANTVKNEKMPSKSLIHFHQEVCPDLSLDSIELTYKLIEEISRLKQELRQDGKYVF